MPQRETETRTQSSRWRESNPRCRYGGPACRHNTSPAAVCRAHLTIFTRGRRGLRSTRAIGSWVGWGSNPRLDGLRDRCKANFCYRPIGHRRRSSCFSSHPLESNQDLSGFNQARRPHAPGWVIRVPAPAGTHVVQLFGFQVAPRRGRPPAGPRRFGDAAVRGPGFEPGSERFRAVRRAELDQPSMSIGISYLVGRPGFEPGGSSDSGFTDRTVSIAGYRPVLL